MAGEVKKVRDALAGSEPLTLAQIQEKTQFKANEISMALCYLMKRNEATREWVKNPKDKGRENVWRYSATM